MKILYAIQATGNGHISRAREIIPHLLNYGELDLLISGRQADVSLPYLIKYKKQGVSYTFGKKGGIDMIDTVKNLHPFDLIKDINTFPVNDYNLIINDFEPVTAWACKLKNKPCVALSHQSAYLSPKTPRPEKRDGFAEWVFRNYAPATDHYGFHFRAFDKYIHTPVIRSEIRKLETSNDGHITVYLPAHADELLVKYFTKIKDVKWDVYTKHSKVAYKKENVNVTPINNDDFIKSLAASDGLLTAGGFESPAEAIHLRKKVMVIPMVGQYEQQCNAIAAKDIGVTMVKEIDGEFTARLRSWLNFGFPPNIHYPDITGKIIEELMTKHATVGLQQVAI
jgi:uncharacterized protein (TIGR00661 family)